MTNPAFKTIKDSIKYWYIPLVVGILFLLLGIYTFASPLESYLALSFIFSMSFLLSGFAEIFFSISNREELANWGWTLIFGVITSLIGILLLARPEISITTLPFYVGFVVLARAVGSVSFALDLKGYGVKDWGYLMFVGILGVIFGFILLWNPVIASLTVIVWTGLGLVLSGIFSIYLSFRLRGLGEEILQS